MGAFPFPFFPVFPSFTWTISMGSLCATKHAWEFIFPFLSFSVAKHRIPSHSLSALRSPKPFYTMKKSHKLRAFLAFIALNLLLLPILWLLVDAILGGSL